MADRDIDPRFGERMRELMQQRGTSFRALATRTYQSASVLHRLAAGQVSAAPDVAGRLDEALGAGGTLAALAPASAPYEGDSAEMMRRTILTAIASLGGNQAVNAHPVTQGLIDQAKQWSTVDDWQELAWEYGHVYMSPAPRGPLLRDAIADLATVQTLLPEARGRRRAGLHDAAARLAGLVASVCSDLSHGREARLTWQMARHLAAESGSVDCVLWVRGQEAIVGLYSDRPMPAMLSLIDQGLGIADRASVVGRVELLAARAQALALSDRPADALAGLGDLQRAFDSLPSAATEREDSAFSWPAISLLHTESFVRARSGPPATAHRSHEAALAACPAVRPVSRCQIELHRASRLVRDGRVGEGADHAVAALTGLPAVRRGRLVLKLAEAALEQVPANAGREVAPLRELVAAGAR